MMTTTTNHHHHHCYCDFVAEAELDVDPAAEVIMNAVITNVGGSGYYDNVVDMADGADMSCPSFDDACVTEVGFPPRNLLCPERSTSRRRSEIISEHGAWYTIAVPLWLRRAFHKQYNEAQVSVTAGLA